MMRVLVASFFKQYIRQNREGMAFLDNTGNRLQGRQKGIALGFNKNHIYKSYKDNLKGNSVDN